MIFWLMFLICPLVTALAYRTGCFNGLLSKDEEVNMAMLAVLSFCWPLGMFTLLVILLLLILGFAGILVIDLWMWIATGKKLEKLQVQTGKKKFSKDRA